MGGTVDVVSTARRRTPRPHSAGRAVLCAPRAGVPARAVPAWGCPRPVLGVSPLGAHLPVGWHLTGPVRPLAASCAFPALLKGGAVCALPGHPVGRVSESRPAGREPRSVLSRFFLASFCFSLGFFLIFLVTF